MTVLSQLRLNIHHRQVRRDLADRHAMHRTLMATMGQAPDSSTARHLFEMLYRVESASHGPMLLLQTAVEPQWDRLPAGYASRPPCSKSIDAALEGITSGDVLRFRLLGNPTRRATGRKIGPNGRPETEFVTTDGRGRTRGKLIALRSDAELLEWLVRKGEQAGFSVPPVAVDPTVPDVTISLPPPLLGKRDTSGVTVASALFDGKLLVVDSDAIRSAVRSGIGRGRSYGLGLLSLGRSS